MGLYAIDSVVDLKASNHSPANAVLSAADTWLDGVDDM
jgi:hypothetical protein